MFVSSCCNNYLIQFLKIGKLKRLKSLRIHLYSNPQPLGLRLRKTCTKRTAENVFHKEAVTTLSHLSLQLLPVEHNSQKIQSLRRWLQLSSSQTTVTGFQHLTMR